MKTLSWVRFEGVDGGHLYREMAALAAMLIEGRADHRA